MVTIGPARETSRGTAPSPLFRLRGRGAEHRPRRAALRLNISQPPLTRQIQQLENELGAQLFHRTPRGVDLTDAGRVLYDDARNILGLADRAAERTSKAAQGLLGRVDVAIFGSGIFGVIPKLLRRFRASYPEVSIQLHNMAKDEQIDALRHHASRWPSTG